MLEENSWCSLFADAFWIPKKDSLEFIDTKNCRIFKFEKRWNFWKTGICNFFFLFFKNNFKSKHQKARLEEFNIACFSLYLWRKFIDCFSLLVYARHYKLWLVYFYSVFCLYHTLLFIYFTLIFVYITLIFKLWLVYFYSVFGLYHTLLFIYVTLIFVYITLIFYVNQE